MATIAFITKRIDGKEKEVERLRKKIARIEEAEASGWEKNPYFYSDSDLRSARQDLDEAIKGLEKYRADLAAAEAAARSRNVPAILEFLEGWKQRNLEFYGKGLKEAFQERDAIRELRRSIQYGGPLQYGDDGYEEICEEIKAREKAYSVNLKGEWRTVTGQLANGRKVTTCEKVSDGKWEYVCHYMRSSYEESMERLQELLDREADRKYDFIIFRTANIVGEITDASYLHIGEKGDLNGYIIGTQGSANVQTIGAGGYNIQCFHFRTLINRRKEEKR